MMICVVHLSQKEKQKKNNYLHLSQNAWVFLTCKIKNQQAPYCITRSVEPEKTAEWNRNTSIGARYVETKQVAVNLKTRSIKDNHATLSTQNSYWRTVSNPIS